MKTKRTVLTKEERDILILAALHPNGKFLNNRGIGHHLGIPVNRVETLIYQACIKLGASDRNEAIVLALRKGDIKLTEFWSLNELEELFSLLEPDILGRISNIVRQVLEYVQSPKNDEQADLMDNEGSNSAKKKIEEIKTKITVLTREERKVLILSATHQDGRHPSNSEIGQRLGISTSHVKIIIHEACTKLGAHNRIEAVLLALKGGEMRLNEIYSLDELTEQLYSLGLGPNILRRMANIINLGPEHKHLSKKDERIALMIRKQGTKLNRIERDIVIFAGLGYTNKEIADKLYLSTNSVSTILRRASRKLGAHKRADAFMIALKQGEINMSDLSSFNELLEYLAPLGSEFIEKIAQMVDQKLGQESTII